MYYIITEDKEIVDFAKRKGANILNSNESTIIKSDVKKVTVNSKGIGANVIEAFFSGFYYANKKTLGFKCVKYILENGIDCVNNNEDKLYGILADKFDTKVRVIKQSLTYFLNNCRFNSKYGMPREFKVFYEKHIKYENKSVEQMNLAFISICEMYLKKSKKK